MKRPALKELLQDECRIDPLFNKGRRRTLVMALLYVFARFSDPIAAIVLSGVRPKLEFNLIFGLFTAVCIGRLAMVGSVKLAGILCLLTPVGNTLVMLSAAKLYSGGFSGMLHSAPVAWYMLAMSVICGAAGIVLLTNRTVARFGKRRKELQKEYAAALKAWAAEPKREYEAPLEQPRPEMEEPPKEQPDAHRPKSAQNAPLQEEEKIEKDAAEQIEKEAAAEKAPEGAAEKVEDDLHRQTIEKHRIELEKESFTLVASSIPTALSKVDKQSFFALYRKMVCKKFGCCEEEVDPVTYILVFPEDKLALIQWILEEKKICIKCNTKRYGPQFHTMILEVVNYLSKNIGMKFDITDLDG